MLKKQKKHALTAIHFRNFIRNCQDWQRRFGMMDFRIEYYMERLDQDSSCAITHFDIEDRAASITINNQWIVPVTDRTLNAVALHEMAHLMLADLTDLGRERHVTAKAIWQANEAAVIRIENCIMGLLK